MPIAGRTPTAAHGSRPVEAGTLLVGAGALLLFVSLFLEWFQPGADAWEVFEVWDLVLALLAVGALAAVAGRLGYAPARPPSWILVTAFGALVIVLHAILNPPPVARGLPDGDPAIGLWLALVASVLMAAGAVISVARISVAISTAGPAHTPPRAADPVHDPVVPAADARRGGGPYPHGEVPPTAEPVAPGVPPTEPTRRL